MKVYTRKVYDTLELLRLRTNFYISKKSIYALSDFLTGYMTLGEWGFEEPDLIYNSGDPDLNEFRFWVNNEPNIPLSQGPSFVPILLEKCNNDEEKAFDMFFELLDKFKREKEEK